MAVTNITSRGERSVRASKKLRSDVKKITELEGELEAASYNIINAST